MAKNSSKKSIAFSYDLTAENLGKQVPLNLDEMYKMLMLHCHMARDDNGVIKNPWDPRFGTSWCLLFVGPAGVGKSAVVKQFAQDNNMDILRPTMGDGAEEDNLGMVQRVYDKNGSHTFSMPSFMPTRPPESKNGGIVFIDEAGTGSNTNQNMLARLFTDGYKHGTGYYGHHVQDGWFWVAATNPDTADYLLNQALDLRVRERMLAINIGSSVERTINHLSKKRALSDTMQGFLRTHESLAASISPRKLEQLAQIIARNEEMKAFSIDEMRNVLALEAPDAFLDAYRSWQLKGNDPDNYPILARQIIKADEQTFNAMVKRLNAWTVNGTDELITATGYEIKSALADPDLKLQGEQIARLIALAVRINKTDLVAEITKNIDNAYTVVAREVLTKAENIRYGKNHINVMNEAAADEMQSRRRGQK